MNDLSQLIDQDTEDLMINGVTMLAWSQMTDQERTRQRLAIILFIPISS